MILIGSISVISFGERKIIIFIYIPTSNIVAAFLS